MNDILSEPCELDDADLDLVAGGVGLEIIISRGAQQAFTSFIHSADELFHSLLNGFASLKIIAKF